MGYIYKITNLTNNKSYIGQTNRAYRERWAEHARDKNKEPYCNWPLYRMLNSVSPELISWEVIEETEDLNNREKYWIEFYNSFYNGYNATLGGENGTKYDYNEILKYWLTDGEQNFTKTALHFNSSKQYISKIISSFGYERRSWEEINSNNHDSQKRKVNQIDLSTGRVINTYNSLSEAGQCFGNKEYGRTISNICNGVRPSYLGYGWQYVEDIGKPIYLNKQIKSIYLPDYDLYFDNRCICADWLIENKLCKSNNRYTISRSIEYAIKHSGKYFGIKIIEKEKVIYTYYE